MSKIYTAYIFISKFLNLENQTKKLTTKARLYLQLINSRPKEEK